jgi:cysteine desulfurase/selenocysteine lyase
MNPLRDPFPITNRFVYLNIANHSPPSTPVKEAVKGFLDDWDDLNRNGDMRVEEACTSFAKLVNASPDEVACQPNTSRGLAAVASSIHLRSGDNVVVNDLENWANIYPWTALRKRGVRVRVLKSREGFIQLEDFKNLVDDDTRAVAISQVQWLTGARQTLKPLADLVHDHGGYLVVDGIQAAGALRVNVKKDDVDFYACGSYKWLLGPSGAGFLYIRRELVEKIQPMEYGYRAIAEHSINEPKLKENAKMMEFGEPSYLSFVGTKAGIDLILRLGTDRVERQIVSLGQFLVEGLTNKGVTLVSPIDLELRSGIVTFTSNNVHNIFDALVKENFVVSLRPSGIRVSTGFYNTAEEVQRFLEKLDEVMKSR